MSNIILTGDRPTGPLHLGHYVGSLKERLKLMDEGDYSKMYVMIADCQALTDNYDNLKKIKDNILEVMLDYLAVGLDPTKVIFILQSEVDALYALNFYYMNLVTLNRLKRNPTIKSEIKERGFTNSIPMGFLTYPISEAADITAFKANIVPVGADQAPLIEQANEIVDSFNRIYDDVLVPIKAHYSSNKLAQRLPGIDGGAKMSKSLGNCIYLKDDRDTLYKKVMSMYTDPNHINIDDPGNTTDNTVFIYLDVFATESHFSKYLPEYKNLDELKRAYEAGGVGDMLVKKFLFNVLDEILTPIRNKRLELAKDPNKVIDILKEGTNIAKIDADKTLREVKKAMQLDYFS